MSKKYYSSDTIRKMDCSYNLIIGKRSNGKSYDALWHGLKDFIDSGYKHQFAVVRRWDEDFTKQRASSMFQSLVCDGNGDNQIEILTGGKYNQIYYYSRRWYLARWNEDTQKVDKAETPCAFGFSLSAMEHDKSTSFPMIKTIVFDEFITRGMYLKDEFVLFMNVVSTIVRNREDVKIFMLANTVNQYGCPYFDEMGLTRIREQKPGTIELYQMGDSELRVAVEYCADSDKISKSKPVGNKYFCFDNPRLKMITDGVWEMDLYPHCPCDYKSTDIVFTFFLMYKGNMLQAEIINVDGPFIYIHKKTTPLKNPDTDMIYSLDYDNRQNWRRRICRPVLPIEKRIWDIFKMDKVFYQDNQTGEIVRSYLNECEAV